LLIFFKLDCNSRICAGKKDCITHRGTKSQKRLLSDTMLNLFNKFKAENKNDKISYTSFCSLRPLWVIQPRVQDRETCLCIKHDNMQFLIDKLHAMNVIDCSTIQQFCNSVCCDTRSKECAYGECNVCKEKQIVVQPGAQLDRQSFYFKWAKQQQTRPGHDNKDIVVNVTTKLRVSATMSEMLSQVNENKSEFVKHCY
jgi:hypothetical protein